MLLFLYGPDSFRIHERVNVLKVGFAQKYDQAGMSLETLSAKEVTADTLPSKLLSGGLFTKKRCVIITEIFDMRDATMETLLSLLDRITDDTILIVTATTLPKEKLPSKQRFLAADRVEEFPLLDVMALGKWVNQRVQEAGAKIDPAASHYLVNAIGQNLWRMHGVIEQLVHYTTKITLADVEVFVASPLDDNIFHFTDALSTRSAGTALRLLHDQLASGANPFYIITMLSRQIIILLQVKAGGKAASTLHPYVQKKASAHAERFSTAQLTEMYGKITAADERMKTTGLDPAVVLDKLVAELTLA